MKEDYKVDEENGTATGLAEFEVLQQVISALRRVDQQAQRRILDSAAIFLGIQRKAAVFGLPDLQTTKEHSSRNSGPRYSEDTAMSPKAFLLEKEPRSDVERIACLAYYLTHYRATPHFKTLDLSVLNMEAAQPKFSNTAYSANNAVKLGYLVASTKGQRQLSALGERFVQALPDRGAAKDVLNSLRRRRSKRKREVPDEAAQG